MTPETSNPYIDRAQKLNEYVAWAALSVLTFCVVLSLAASWLNAEFPEALPHAFNGKENIYYKDAPNYFRNAAELLNFATAAFAALAVPLVAIWAARLARRQAVEASRARVEAENSRLSSIYMAIVERWHSDKVLNSRKKLLDLVGMHKNANSGGATSKNQHNYIADSLDGLDVLELYSYTLLIQFFEDVGALCYKEYVRKNDIFDLMGGSIIYQLGCYEEHIRRSRTRTGTKSTYANAIYLYKEAQAFASIHEEDMWETK